MERADKIFPYQNEGRQELEIIKGINLFQFLEPLQDSPSAA